MRNNRETPWKRLSREKEELRQQCRQSEERIAEDWRYIRSHAGSLLLSELTSAFTTPRERKGAEGSGLPSGQWTRMVWQVVRPVAERWIGDIGWQVFKSMYKRRG